MNQGTMFGVPSSKPEKPLSAGRRRTIKAHEAIAGGLHPMTRRPLLANGLTCGDCTHLDGSTYFKCDRMERTRGPATDIRKSWPACNLYEAP